MKLASNSNLPEPDRALVLKDAEQLTFLEVPAAGTKRNLSPLPIATGSPSQRERVRLEQKYRDAFEHRLDWRRLVTYVPNKGLPVYNWFKYKEGFSRELVVRLVRQFGLQKGDIVFDPFVGCGTTLLAAQELGLHGIGVDILPTSVFVARAKLTKWPDLDEILSASQKLLEAPFREPKSTFPRDVRIINLAFTKETQAELLFFKEETEKFQPPFRHFLLLGLLSILESVSRTSKDGQFLRLVDKKIPPVREALRSILGRMAADLSELRTFGQEPKTKAVVRQGDAREMCLPVRYEGRVAAIITSPPYLNRYDYSRTYALELCLLTAKSHRDMVNIRHSLLRSHVESREHANKAIELPALDLGSGVSFRSFCENRPKIEDGHRCFCSSRCFFSSLASVL